MYDELIKRLRRWANSFCGCCKHADKKQKACDDCAAVYGSLWEAADAIEDLITALTASNEVIAKNKPKWIPVTERLPDENDVVLITDSINVGTGYLIHGYGWISPFDDIDISHVSHWMPLPQPPESERTK